MIFEDSGVYTTVHAINFSPCSLSGTARIPTVDFDRRRRRRELIMDKYQIIYTEDKNLKKKLKISWKKTTTIPSTRINAFPLPLLIFRILPTTICPPVKLFCGLCAPHYLWTNWSWNVKRWFVMVTPLKYRIILHISL